MIVATANVWDAVVAALTLGGVIVNAVLLLRNAGRLKTPSGDRVGHVVERAHDISAATLLAVTKLNGDHGPTGKGGP